MRTEPEVPVPVPHVRCPEPAEECGLQLVERERLDHLPAVGVSNRLSSLADAAGATAESWDAEAGSFTSDASGNMLATGRISR